MIHMERWHPMAQRALIVCFAAIMVAAFFRDEVEGMFEDYLSSPLQEAGVAGPFRAVREAEGAYVAREPAPTIQPGERFAFIPTLCVRRGYRISVEQRMENLNTHQIIHRSSVTFPDGTVRCGSLTVTAVVPPDAPPGSYLHHRIMTLQRPGRGTRSFELLPLRFLVTPAG